MKRFLLDTGIDSDYINRRHGVYERARDEVAKGNQIGIGVPVLAELLFGIELSATRDKNLKRLQKALPTLTRWPFTETAAAQYGRLAAELKRSGRPIQVMDLMIAAIALSLVKCTVVSSDTDFAVVPGLTVENWASYRTPIIRGTACVAWPDAIPTVGYSAPCNPCAFPPGSQVVACRETASRIRAVDMRSTDRRESCNPRSRAGLERAS